MRRICRACVEQCLQPSGRTVKKKRFNIRVARRHGIQITLPGASVILSAMDVVAFTRQLVDMESITGNESEVGDFLYRELSRANWRAEKLPVEGDRQNIYATPPPSSCVNKASTPGCFFWLAKNATASEPDSRMNILQGHDFLSMENQPKT